MKKQTLSFYTKQVIINSNGADIKLRDDGLKFQSYGNEEIAIEAEVGLDSIACDILPNLDAETICDYSDEDALLNELIERKGLDWIMSQYGLKLDPLNNYEDCRGI